MSRQQGSHHNDSSTDIKAEFGNSEHIEGQDVAASSAESASAYKSKWEELGRVKTIKLFWKMSLVCFVVAFSAAADGYQVTLAGNIIANKGFIKQFATEIDANGEPIIAAQVFAIWGPLGSVGQWIGMNTAPFIADRFGRKIVLIWIACVLALSVGIECGARHWGVWAVAKVFGLIGIGSMQSMMQVYLTEMSPTSSVRGTMLACYNLWWAIGQFFGPLALKIMNDNNPDVWLTPVYSQWGHIGLLFIIYVFVPETPWWCVLTGRIDKARKILLQLNGKIPGYDADEELEIMKRTVVLENQMALSHEQNKYVAIFQGADGWRTLCACWSLVVQQTIGLGLIYSYVTYFFELAGQKDPFKTTVITASLGVVAIFFLIYGIDKVGRRPLVLGCYIVCWVCLILIGAVNEITPTASTKNSLVAFACIWSFAMNLSGGVCWAYVGEVASSRLRSRTAGFSASVSVVIGIVFGVLVPYMINVNQWNWGLRSAFFFAGISAIPIISCYFILPETKGRSTAELDEMFEKKVRSWRMKSYVTETQTNREAVGIMIQMA